MQVDFYHLTAAPVDRVLPRIAGRVLAGGGRLLVVADDTDLLERLDAQLWAQPPDGFVPHGIAGRCDEAAQPVLLSAEPMAANGARNIALADGVWRDEALTFDRAFLLFDEARIDAARGHWRTLSRREDVAARYWKQDEAGRWAAAG